MADEIPTVTARAAVEWTCPGCGADNFARVVERPLATLLAEAAGEDAGPGEVEELAAAADEAFEGGDWYALPASVRCKECGGRFRPTAGG